METFIFLFILSCFQPYIPMSQNVLKYPQDISLEASEWNGWNDGLTYLNLKTIYSMGFIN